MHARSAVFDLYGDHLASRGGWAPIASVVRLLGAVDVAAPAVRTAVSRLAREGWLAPQERGGVRGYEATPRATRRLAKAWERIYRTDEQPWDGLWHIVACEHVADRSRRTRVTASLTYLGYARLGTDTWIAPRASDELESALEGLQARLFHSRLDGNGAELATSLWDLEGLARAYDDFLAWAGRVAPPEGEDPEAVEEAFAVRTLLVHEWRKFLFTDPGLPAEVLPAHWSGRAAAQRFDTLTHELLPAASTFVDACLTGEEVPTAGTSADAVRSID